MKTSLTKNYIYNLVYQIILVIVPIVTTPYLARVLGADKIGVYSYTVSIATYAVFFGSLGITLYGVREIAYYRDDVIKKTKVFLEIFLLRLITMVIAIIIYYFLFCQSGEYSIYFRVLLIYLFSSIIDISWFYQGEERIKRVVIINLIVKILWLISVFLFIKTANDVDNYVILYGISSLLANSLLWININKSLSKIKINCLSIFKHFKGLIILFIPQIAQETYVLLDKIMLGSILNNMYEVGYYEESQKIVRIFLLIMTSLNVVLVPKIANLYSKKNEKVIKEYIYKSLNFVFMIGFPLSLGLFTISDSFIPLFLGDGFDKVSLLIKITCFVIVFIGIINIIGTQYLMVVKREKEYTISIIIGIITNFILNYLLIPKFLSIGSSIATIISEMAIVISLFYFTRKDFDIKKIFKMSFNYIISSLIMLIILLLLDSLINNLILLIISKIIAGVIIYLGLLILLKDNFVFKLKKSILNKKIC